MNNINKILFILLVLSTLFLHSQDWERVEGPYSYAFVRDMFEFNNQLYVPSYSDPIYYKLNNDKWEFSDTEFPIPARIEFTKQKDNIIFVSAFDSSYISTNSGKSWNTIPHHSYLYDVKKAHIINEKIFIRPAAWIDTLSYYSIPDNKWLRVQIEGEDLNVLGQDVTSYENYVYLTSAVDFAGTKHLIIRSSDYGDTWEILDSIDVKVKDIIVHNDILFVAGEDKHLYKSYDFGDSWVVDTTKNFPVDMFYSLDDNLFASVNSIGYKDSIDVGVHLSTDNGETWEHRHNGIININIEDFHYFDGKLYCENDRSMLFQTSDLGKNWERCNILTDSIITYDLFTENDTLYAGTLSRSGIQYTTQEGTSWENFSDGLSSRIWEIYKRDNVVVNILEVRGFIEISSDYGKTWLQTSTGVQDLLRTPHQDVEFLQDSTILLASIFGTRITTDFGKTWDGYQNEILKPEYPTYHILRISDNKLLVVAKDEGLFKSTDNGISWEKVETEFPDIYQTNFETFEYNDGKIYAFIPSYTDLPAKGWFYSEDEGVTWTEFNEEFTEKGTDNGITFLNNFVIASTQRGIIYSSDGGKTAKSFEIELPDTSNYITDIAVQGDYLIASSDNGVYRTTLQSLGLTTSSVESETERNYLYTLPPYPNPASSEIKVLTYWDINLPMNESDISVYDLSGREVNTEGKINIVKQADHYGRITWDCSGEKTGIYIINIKHGTEEKAVKVVVE